MSRTGEISTLRSLDDFELLLQHSHHRPVLLFKHSLECYGSDRALAELLRYVIDDKGRTIDCALVKVQLHPDVSEAAASRLHVDHESPQAILIQNSQPVWWGSHREVTAETLRSTITALVG
jgi:bacillithiol system protein YtxJ